MISKSLLASIISEFSELNSGTAVDSDALSHFIVHRLFAAMQANAYPKETLLGPALEVLYEQLGDDGELVCKRCGDLYAESGIWNYYCGSWICKISAVNLAKNQQLADSLIQLAREISERTHKR
jgi:hypothetical protein